ncbi:Metallo-beta-lactamase L1 type 3 [bacterium HR08]|nr:Metallo-beta-lactamase L1 type 3 [bacterium HR08]
MRITESIYLVGSLQFGLSGPWDCHVYLLKGPEGLVLIDAGGGTHDEQILRNVEREGFDPRDVCALLLTHNHFDHSCGAARLRALTGCRVYLSEVSREQLERGTETDVGLDLAKAMGIYPSDFRYRHCPVDHAVRDGEVIEVGGLRFEAIAVAGHSPDSICYLVELEGRRNLFVGDVLFYGGILGLINFPGSTMEGYRRDLHKLAGLRIDGLFPGHMLFTLRDGQRHIDAALEQCRRGVIPRSIGQFELIF